MNDDDLRKADRRERPGEFGVGNQGRVAVYQGEKPVVPEVVGDKPGPLAKANAARKIQKSWGLTRKEAAFFMALPGTTSFAEAWRKAFPDDKSSPTNQRCKAGRYRRAIMAKIGDDEMLEVNGLGHQAFMAAFSRMLNAQVQREFIDMKTAQVIEGKVRPDNTTQMTAVKLLAGVLGYARDDKNGGGGPITVQVIQYAPNGSSPWPGGGRS